MNWQLKLLDKLISKEIGVSIFGMGYVGLPIAVNASETLKNLIYGIEISDSKLQLLKSAKSYIDDISNEELSHAITNGVVFTNNVKEAITNSSISIICVPTPVDNAGFPNLQYIFQVAASIASEIKAKKDSHIVVLESTTYPTTTEGEVNQIFVDAGLLLHQDYELCFSPERISPGDKSFNLTNIPKILGTTSDDSYQLIKYFYEEIIGTTIVKASSPRAAEMTKLFENIFRQVNIALVNELAILSEKMQIDMFEVINLAATKPFAFLAHYPGPGLGGHCIPVDPYYLSYIAKKYHSSTNFIDLASQINSQMTDHTIKLIQLALNRVNKSYTASTIGILGYSYKPNIMDIRNSPAIPIINSLKKLGANILICDDIIESNPLLTTNDLDYVLNKSDVVVIITPHNYFDWTKIMNNLRPSQPIVDTRGVIPYTQFRPIDVGLGRPIDEYQF
ncbi:MAG: nucleotide sugar dehydrogenase [Candidatus Heimdallarchaeota archaeon]|nr:nucleotide sugar dehydrogenase [Candidatus Heimdallarchaeota archaeon]